MELQRDVRLSVVLPADKRLAQLAAQLTGLAGSAAAERPGDAEAETQPESADAAARDGHEVRSLDRDFAFPGEQATLFVLVTPRGDGRAGQFDQQDFASMCRSLEVIIDASNCVVGTVMLCPEQPRGRQVWPPAADTDADADADAGAAGDPFAALRGAVGNACATYYFQIAMPESSADAAGGASGWVDLDLQCRFKSRSVQSLVSRAATGLQLSNQQAIDPMGFATALPRAQEILHSGGDGRDQSHGRAAAAGSSSSQTVQLSKRVRRVQCAAVRSRCRQVDDKGFIEVVFENVHPSLRLELKDITLHTQTTLPVVFSVARVGRWCLPMQLLPGEKQSVCFEVSGFGDTDPANPHVLAEGDSVGARLSSLATVTWSSGVTLPYVRAQHAVKWCGFQSSLFCPVAARFVKNEQETVQITQGDSFQINLEVANRMPPGSDVDLHVLLPVQANADHVPVLPLDAAVHVGTITPEQGPFYVPVHFVALHPGSVDLSDCVCLYDARADKRYRLLEPTQLTVFPPVR